MAEIPAVARGLVRPRAARDEILQRGLFLVVLLYFACTLLLPLALVGVKAVQTFAFRFDRIEVETLRADGVSARSTLAEIAAGIGYEPNRGHAASERSREQPGRIIPLRDRREAEAFRLRDLSASGGLLLVDGAEVPAGDWIEVAPGALGSVQIRPAMRLGLDNFRRYFGTPALWRSIFNSLGLSLLVAAIVTPLAFLLAYGLGRTRMPAKGALRLVIMLPVLMPSLLPAIGLVHLFGRQGVLTPLLFGAEIYGPPGIVLASLFHTLPHALVIMTVALGTADRRLYEAAEVLRASPWRTFRTVTWPGVRYGFVSAGFVVFTLTATDFGIPKVIGGDHPMLALDIYKQVIGQQNFQMGAVVSLVLLLPALAAFALDRLASRRQTALLTARAVPFVPKADRPRDRFFLLACLHRSSSSPCWSCAMWRPW